MVLVFIGKEDAIFNEDGARSQDEGDEEVDVDVVSGAVELPVEQDKKKRPHTKHF